VSISPNAPLPPAESGGSGLKIPILFGAVLALIAANVYLFMKLEENEADLAPSKRNAAAPRPPWAPHAKRRTGRWPRPSAS